MNPSYLEKYGLGLISNNYKIIPIKKGSKIPAIKGWTKIDADLNQLEQWISAGFEGVGILCKGNPAVDIDILDEEVSRQMVKAVLQKYPSGLIRVGKAPKTLLAYRTDKPFKKVRSKTYEDIFGDHHAVEILGDGQQYVAYAEHPDILKPYMWHGDGNGAPPGIFEVESNSPTIFNLEDARAVVSLFEEIATEKVATDGWVKVKDGTNGSQTDVQGVDIEGDVDEIDFANIKPRLGLDDGAIRRALTSIAKPTYYIYENWVKVGMAVWHETNGSEEGLEYWVQWSEQDPNFKSEEDCRSRWPGFRPNRGSRVTTMATVLKWARDERMEDDPLKEFKDRYIYVTDGDCIHDLEGFGHDKPMLMREFRNSTANIRMEIEVSAPLARDEDRTKTKLVPVHQQWLVDPERKSAQGFSYKPGNPRLIKDGEGKQWINTFHLPEFPNPCEMTDENGVTKVDTVRTDSLLATFFRHMEFIIPIEGEREWFYSWMAFNIQKPHIRCKVTPLLIATDHGTGRGWIVQLMNLLLGVWNCKKTKMSTLSGESSAGQFQEFINDSLLCCVEEVREGEKRYGVEESIRDYLTENTIEINIKYGGKQTKPVYTKFFFNSNRVDALKLTADDRRINIFRTVDGPKPNDYYDRLYGWLEPEDQVSGEMATLEETANGEESEGAVYDRAGVKVSAGVACLFHWLKSRELTGFNWQRSMDNKTRQEMIENNQTDIEYHFLEMVKNPLFPVMTLNEIEVHLGKQMKDDFLFKSPKAQIRKLAQQYLGKQERVKISREYDQKKRALVPLPTPYEVKSWSFDKRKVFSREEIREMYENR